LSFDTNYIIIFGATKNETPTNVGAYYGDANQFTSETW